MTSLQRLRFEQTPIYILPDRPEWLVPNAAGDRLLSGRQSAPACDTPLEEIRRRRFLSLLPAADSQIYNGRHELLELTHLEECWLHITDQCNLCCSHCLFACSPKTRMSLPLESLQAVYEQACNLGARVFYLTGGEPMMHPDFPEICRQILNKHPDTHLVVLTNGLLMPAFEGLFKSLPQQRLHLQISIDGLAGAHDALRGEGAFEKLMTAMDSIAGLQTENTLAMAVHSANAGQMADIVELAADLPVSGVHYLWLMITGQAGPADFVPPQRLFTELMRAAQAAEKRGLKIDNLENIASQVFSTPGTKHDLGNAGWTSLAVGPDGTVHPTPALIGRRKTACGHISQGLETVWKNSETLSGLRRLSVVDSPAYMENPLKYIVGGGDVDHSFYAGNEYVGHDPYVPLYNQMALWLIHRAAEDRATSSGGPRIRLKMGDRLRQCHQDGRGVALTHSNCVLTFADTRRVVGDFYNQAAQEQNTDIANPVCYPEDTVAHIPHAARIRSYGCGSPVTDADPAPGQTVVDLGAGAGLECFIAARQVGKSGRVIGIDMLDEMIFRAERSARAVARNLGYENVGFQKGFLEQIPLADNTADLIISNCVINLSEDKRKTFAEMIRVLKPGGRIVISDVVTDAQMPPEIANDEKLRGECIAGAMRQEYLIAMLEDAGFGRIQILKRFFYRKVQNHPFYALTYSAYRPGLGQTRRIIYPGPYAAAVTDSGDLLIRGRQDDIDWPYPAKEDASVLLLDDQGNAENRSAENTCTCYTPSKDTGGTAPGLEIKTGYPAAEYEEAGAAPHPVDCMHCGKPLVYLDREELRTCVFCGKTGPANAICEAGHFVCDACHSRDAVEIVRQICLNTAQTEMIPLLDTIRSHPAFSVHGPEHHFAVPAVIVATFRNRGGSVMHQDIQTALDRGRSVPGGTCAFWGACAAALGVGIGFGVILESNPLKPDPRQAVQKAVGEIISKLSEIKAARCCRRETYTALIMAARQSRHLLPFPLEAGQISECTQQTLNRECIWQACPQAGSARQSFVIKMQ